MNFKDKLYNIIDDTKRFHRPKESLMRIYVEERLEKSLIAYCDDLVSSYKYIDNKNSVSVMNSMSRRKIK